MAKVGKTKLPKATATTKASDKTLKASAATKKLPSTKPVAAKPAAATVVAEAQPASKKVSQKLIETIERRKKSQEAAGGRKAPLFAGRPPGRRGRRPKGSVEYTPQHQEEDNLSMENEYERIEYDTGIRLKDSGDDGAMSLDRFEDFDEELNFDR